MSMSARGNFSVCLQRNNYITAAKQAKYCSFSKCFLRKKRTWKPAKIWWNLCWYNDGRRYRGVDAKFIDNFYSLALSWLCTTAASLTTRNSGRAAARQIHSSRRIGTDVPRRWNNRHSLPWWRQVHDPVGTRPLAYSAAMFKKIIATTFCTWIAGLLNACSKYRRWFLELYIPCTIVCHVKRVSRWTVCLLLWLF